jgi:hypothetical protein
MFSKFLGQFQRDFCKHAPGAPDPRPLDSFQDQTPCIFNHPNLGTLAHCFPTRPIWNLGFFQPSIMKNDNFHDLCWYFKVFRSRFEHSKAQKFTKSVQKHFSNEMKIHFFIEDTHLSQRFPNASTVTWSLVLQTRNLVNKIEEFPKCDDFSGEIRSAHR